MSLFLSVELPAPLQYNVGMPRGQEANVLTPYRLRTLATLSWGAGGKRRERRCFLIDSPNRRQNRLFILVHRVWRNEFGNTYVIHVAIAIKFQAAIAAVGYRQLLTAHTPRVS